MPRLLVRLRTYARITLKARRNRTDLVRYLIRRPALLAAVSTYETALLASNRADTRLKLLANVKTATLVGCPF